ncbi:MAG: pyridoxamine 5'-phosphate oxidase family protein [Actinomycetota bacterium]
MTVRSSLTTVRTQARPITERVVWATVATVGPDGHPRTRLMHPVWFWDSEIPTALVSARPTRLKIEHLAAQPAISCHYWDPNHDTVAIDAVATWVPAEERQLAWDKVRAVPEPVGFDPAIIWPEGSSATDCAFLQLTAHRIIARPAGTAGVRWDRLPT